MITRLSDIDLLDMIKGTVRKYRYRFCPHCRDDDDDLAMDIYLHFKQKGFLERFNPAVCEIHYYIWMGCRNYMIDQERKLKNVEYSSFDEEFSTPGQELKLLDPNEGLSKKQKDMLSGLIEKLDDEPLGSVAETPIGDLVPSEKSIMKLYLESYKPTEIGQFFHMSRLKIKKIIDDAIAQLKQFVQGREILMADAFKGFSAEEIGLLLETYYSVNLVKYLTEEQKQLFDMEFILDYGVRVDPIVGGVSLIIPIVHGEAEVDLSVVKKAISDTLDLYHLDFSLIEPYFNEAVTIRTPGVASHLAIEDMPAERWALRIDLPDKITLVSNKHFCIECGGPLVGKNKKYCSDCDLEAEDFEELTDSEDFKELSLEQLREKRRQLLSALEQLSQMSEYADESVSEIKCREDLEVVEKEIANKVSGGRSLQLTEASRIIHELYPHVQESLRPKSGKARIFRLIGEPTALEAGAPMIGVREFSKEFQLINFAERPVELIRRLNAAGYSETDENIVHIYDREVKMKNVICEKCRKPVALSDRFCGHCGSKFF